MNEGIDLTPRWEDFAVYLPAIQKSYALAAHRTAAKDRVMPDGISMKDLNFLSPTSSLWHYGYALYSAGQFDYGERLKPDIVRNREESSSVTILGDSGGFQIGAGTLSGLDNLKRQKDPENVCDAWSDAVEIKTWILDWLENYSDYAMTIDIPLWTREQRNEKSPFNKCSVEQLIELTVQNLRFIKHNSNGNTRWLNVVQGGTEEETKLWWDAVKDFRFNGWALAGSVSWRGGAATVIKQVLIMRDEGAFEEGLDWIHMLGVSQPKWAVFLTAIQRGLRQYCNKRIRVSYDSASPFVESGRYQNIALYPAFRDQLSSWKISSVRCPLDKVYVTGNPVYAFPFSSPIGDRLKMNDINVKDEPFDGNYADAVSWHLVTNHNIWVYVRSMLSANELTFLDKHDAQNFVPEELLKCIDVCQELLTSKKWYPKWKKHRQLLESL